MRLSDGVEWGVHVCALLATLPEDGAPRFAAALSNSTRRPLPLIPSTVEGASAAEHWREQRRTT